MVTKEQKEQIVELRKQKKSYGDIAKIIGIKKDQVKGYVQSTGFKNTYPELIGFIKGQRGDKLNISNIEKRVEEKFPTFQYISGYKNCESIIKIKCKLCGDTTERNAQILRKDKELECSNCAKLKREAKKEKSRQLSAIRKTERKRLLVIKKEEHIKSITKEKICKQCGNKFFTTNNTKEYCNAKCGNRYQNHVKEAKRRYKLKQNGKVDYTITLDKLIKRDKSICKICNRKININDRYIDNEGNFIAGNTYPSIDHIQSVSKGGTHTWDNIQLAHRNCNSIKSNKNIYNKESGQLTFAM